MELAMTKDYREITRAVSASVSKFRANQPDVIKNFNALSAAALRDGVLSEKTKELMALCLSIGGHCDACIGFHVRTLVRLGVTRAELEETLAVCVYMGGGPSLMYAADALSAFEQYSAAAQPAPA
jgi:AhpD family alkylhydroperoxidase